MEVLKIYNILDILQILEHATKLEMGFGKKRRVKMTLKFWFEKVGIKLSLTITGKPPSRIIFEIENG